MIEIFKIKSGNHNIDLHTNAVKNPKGIILCLHGFNGDLWVDGFLKLKDAFDDVLVCSFDSAGHGNSEIKAMDMRLDLINKEIFDVVLFLTKHYINTPIIIYALSYGAYRTITTLANFDLPNIKHIVFVNPAFKMIDVLQKTKGFDYLKLEKDSIVPMKSKLNKFMTKNFLDEIYQNNVYKMKFKQVPMTIVIGKNDNLISADDKLDFAKLHKCDVVYIDDGHCIENQESWQTIINFLGEIL